MPSILEQFGDCLARSFKELLDFRHEFESRTFSTYDEAAKELTMNWDPRFLPNFEARDGRVRSHQERFFTVFPFAEAVSEFLIGIQELGAYEVLEAKDHDQFANFVSYTSCFHLVDSFLCSGGMYFIPSPVADCIWAVERNAIDRRIVTRWSHGVPTCHLQISKLRIKNQLPRYLVARWNNSNESRSEWSFRAENGPIHGSRWECFGKELKALISGGNIDSIPRKVQRFFEVFAGHLISSGVVSPEETPSLSNLIQFACFKSNLNGIKSAPAIPSLRHLAIYRNQSTDEHMRVAARFLDPIVSPVKIYGVYFNRLADALAEWQTERLGIILDSAKKSLSSEVFLNGVKSAIFLSGLLELDFGKIVDSRFFDDIHSSIRDVVGFLFRKSNFIPGTILGPVWQVGTLPDYPKFHGIRLPTTLSSVLTLKQGWLPR